MHANATGIGYSAGRTYLSGALAKKKSTAKLAQHMLMNQVTIAARSGCVVFLDRILASGRRRDLRQILTDYARSGDILSYVDPRGSKCDLSS